MIKDFREVTKLDKIICSKDSDDIAFLNYSSFKIYKINDKHEFNVSGEGMVKNFKEFEINKYSLEKIRFI